MSYRQNLITSKIEREKPKHATCCNDSCDCKMKEAWWLDSLCTGGILLHNPGYPPLSKCHRILKTSAFTLQTYPLAYKYYMGKGKCNLKRRLLCIMRRLSPKWFRESAKRSQRRRFLILRCRLFQSFWSKRLKELDCSPSNRERELCLDRRETG